MISPAPSALEVYVDIAGETLLAGAATFRYRGATTTTEFTYSQTYLQNRAAYALGPELPLARSAVVVEGLPACFADSTPDWWGRQLVAKRLRLETSLAGKPPVMLTDVDYLVGASDQARQGSLRYAEPRSAIFLDPDPSVPKLLALPELLHASDQVAAGDVADESAAVKTLLAAGSATLGGARPKASVEDDGRLWIAKFPHQADEWDVIAWEKTVLDLAERCGIEVPQRRLVHVAGRPVLLLARFDRDDSRRIGYVSARTLAEATSSAGNDYLDMVAAIEDHSANAAADLGALWTRIAFTVAVNNTDDHFHNHGFIRSRGGWVLAPAFDINIDPQVAQPRSSALAGAETRPDSLDALVSQSAYFGLDQNQARAGLVEIRDALAGWRDVARANHVAEGELDAVGRPLDDFQGLAGG